MEKQLILERDLDAHSSSCWFMISSEWLYQWKCFISNKISQNHSLNGQQVYVRMSESEKIGVLPPGPIANHSLFLRINDKDADIKSNLQLNVDYRGVNKEVW